MYKLVKDNITGETKMVSKVVENGVEFIPLNAPANTDYQAYLKWLEEGNQPEPAEE